MSVRPGQNGPGSDAGSSSNSPALGGIKREGGEGPSAMQLSGGGGGGGAASSSGGAPDDQSRDQDRLLPIANISRLMKRVLPDHAKMSKEAKAALQESVSEFIGFITSEASDRLVEEKRKTITGDDIIDSMRALGFDSYMEFLTSYLKKYRQSIKASKGGGGTKSEAGAHKRGRKARGADDDDDEEEAGSHEADSFDGGSVGAGAVTPMTMQALLAQQLAHANAASGAGNTEAHADAAKKRKQ